MEEFQHKSRREAEAEKASDTILYMQRAI